jgi:hypothetical protein
VSTRVSAGSCAPVVRRRFWLRLLCVVLVIVNGYATPYVSVALLMATWWLPRVPLALAFNGVTRGLVLCGVGACPDVVSLTCIAQPCIAVNWGLCVVVSECHDLLVVRCMEDVPQ